MQGERGAALMLALLAVLITGAMAGTLTEATRWLASEQIDRRATMQALHAAEGGIAFARAALRRDPTFAGSEVTIGAARVRIDVEAKGSGRWQVRATAECQPRGERGLPYRRFVEVDLEQRPGLPAIVAWRERPSRR